MPGYVNLGCPTCKGTGSGWDEGVSLLASVVTGQPIRPGGEVDCPDCDGTGRGEWRWVGDPELLDTESSASRQHYIDTGRYLTRAETAEPAEEVENCERCGTAFDPDEAGTTDSRQGISLCATCTSNNDGRVTL
jgi:hypothetical protein